MRLQYKNNRQGQCCPNIFTNCTLYCFVSLFRIPPSAPPHPAPLRTQWLEKYSIIFRIMQIIHQIWNNRMMGDYLSLRVTLLKQTHTPMSGVPALQFGPFCSRAFFKTDLSLLPRLHSSPPRSLKKYFPALYIAALLHWLWRWPYGELRAEWFTGYEGVRTI